jgi:UDP-2,4-diacetamido-2,4,6-trideoxy-beta-L-altropyranose hydrolase
MEGGQKLEEIKVCFRTDGNNDLGMGHIMRCISLADELKEAANAEIFFIMKDHKVAITKVSEEYNFGIITIPRNIDENNEMNYTNSKLKELKPDVTIIDLQNITKRFFLKLKTGSSTLYTVDSLNPIDFSPDILVNYNLYADSRLYQTIAGKTKLCLGPEFFMLDKTFEKITREEKMIERKAKQFLLTFGGSDPNNLTTKVVNALGGMNKNLELTVVLGPFFKHHDELNKALKDVCVNRIVKSNVKNMAELIFKSDIAITTGGNTCFETAYVGTPSIILSQVKLQNENGREFDKRGVSINLGMANSVSNDLISKVVKSLLLNYSLRQKMSVKGKNLVDGKGKQRVIKEILRYI